MIPAGHTPLVIADEKVLDAQHKICVRCDGDPTTDSWHLFVITAATTSEDVQAEIDGHKDRVSNLHAAKLNAEVVVEQALATDAAVAAAALAAKPPV